MNTQYLIGEACFQTGKLTMLLATVEASGISRELRLVKLSLPIARYRGLTRLALARSSRGLYKGKSI
jgi:hypothetical protein